MKIALLGICLASGLLIATAPVLAAKCEKAAPSGDANIVDCQQHKGLAMYLTRGGGSGKGLVLRFYGGSGEAFSDGPDRLLFEEVVGEAPGRFMYFGEAHVMKVLDADADGHADLVVASLAPVRGAERKLKIYSLDPDGQLFTGAHFFQHAPGHGEDAFLSYPLGAEASVGRTVRIAYPDGSHLEYRPKSPNIFTLVVDTRPNRPSRPVEKPPLELATGDRDALIRRAEVSSAKARRLYSTGNSAQALPHFEEAWSLRREAYGQRHPETLESMGNYAFTLHQLGRGVEAEKLLREVLRQQRELLGERDPRTIITLNNQAMVLRRLGRLTEAERTFLEVLRLRREILGERHPDTAATLNNYGTVLQDLGRLTDAEPVFAESLRLKREIFGDKHSETLLGLNNYGYLLGLMGRHEEAEPILAESLRLKREIVGNRHPETLLALNNYALALNDLGKLDEAERLLSEVMRVRIETQGKRRPDTITAINNYAAVLGKLERRTEAEPLYKEALELAREVLGERHPDTIQSLMNYASIVRSLRRFTEAAPLYAEAYGLYREVLGENLPATLDSQKRLARNLLRIGKIGEALPHSRELAAATRSRAATLAGGGLRGALQRDRELSDRQEVEKLLADILWTSFDADRSAGDRLPEEAFTALQLSSAGSTSRAVAEAAALRFASEQGLQGLVQERQALTRDWTEIEADLVKSQVGKGASSVARSRLRTRLGQVESRIGEIDRQLARDAPRYFAILNQQAVDLEQARRVLGKDEAVLFLVPSPWGTHVMALTRDDLGWARPRLSAGSVAKQISKFRDGLEVKADAYLPIFDLGLAHELYSQIIAPVEDVLEGKRRVYVIADGALSRLPLGTLVVSKPTADADPNDPEVLRAADWLADRYALVQLPSLQALVYIRSFGSAHSKGGRKTFTGFGAPVLEGKSRLRGARSATLGPVDAAGLVGDRTPSGAVLMDPAALRKLSRLPGTRLELEQVRKGLRASGKSLFLAERMTETAIRGADLSGTAILHLATHGFTSEESGNLAEPGLVFTPPATAEPRDDGYLAASEVVGLDLTSAEWVILSACNTASPSGKSGETGLSGLAQAFFYAGAQSLLVSHWPVFDDIAPVLTVAALTRSREGLPRAEALQQAMRDIRNDPKLDAAHPAVWAPFVLVGEGR